MAMRFAIILFTWIPALALPEGAGMTHGESRTKNIKITLSQFSNRPLKITPQPITPPHRLKSSI